MHLTNPIFVWRLKERFKEISWGEILLILLYPIRILWWWNNSLRLMRLRYVHMIGLNLIYYRENNRIKIMHRRLSNLSRKQLINSLKLFKSLMKMSLQVTIKLRIIMEIRKWMEQLLSKSLNQILNINKNSNNNHSNNSYNNSNSYNNNNCNRNSKNSINKISCLQYIAINSRFIIN